MNAVRIIMAVSLLSLFAQSDVFSEKMEGAMKLTVTSKAFKSGEMIPARYTCDGDNYSPQIGWSEPPPKTKSFVIICDDPDAPRGEWVHWVVYNIPEGVREMPMHALRRERLDNGARQGMNDSQATGYDGPCPPRGMHRYYFKVYALDITLKLEPGARKKDVEQVIAGHILSNGYIMGRYER